MNRRIISALLVFLLLASVAVPAVNAEPGPFAGAAVVAAPAAAKLVIDGITVILTSAVIIELGKNIGKTWDGVAENWDNFVKGVSKELEKLLHAKEWIKVTSPEGKAVMKAVYELYAAGGSSGGKDDKWFFEARKHSGRLEINSEPMTEEQALKEMNRGKNILTVDENLARDIVRKQAGDPKMDVKFKKHSGGKEKFFKHANYEAKGMRLHCWIWES